MKIKYKKRHRISNLIFGVVWSLLWISNICFDNDKDNRWINYFWLIASLFYFVLYFYESYYQYLTIKNGIIKINSLSEKKINLSEIKEIKKYAGDYILKTETNKLTINTQLIDSESLKVLNNELKKLNVQWA